MGSDVLGYGAFGSIAVFRDRTARLTQPTLDARSARAGRVGRGMWVYRLRFKMPALTWQTISEPRCIERNTPNLSRRRRDLFLTGQRRIVQDCWFGLAL